MTARVPPKGATLATFGSEQATMPEHALLRRPASGRPPGRRCGGCAVSPWTRGRVRARAGNHAVERQFHQPGAGQALPVPQHGCRLAADLAWRARLRVMVLLFDFAQIGREQGQAMGVVAEQVAVEQRTRHAGRRAPGPVPRRSATDRAIVRARQRRSGCVMGQPLRVSAGICSNDARAAG